MMDNLNYQYFSDINLDDPFFESLKQDYAEFEDWFNRKGASKEAAYVLSTSTGLIDGFMYLKVEQGEVLDTTPPLNEGLHLKIGTFKFNSQGTRRGERFIKKVFDFAIEYDVDDIYVTVFSKHSYLIQLFNRYGFSQHGLKTTDNGEELCLVRNMRTLKNDSSLDYPLINTNEKVPHLLSIYPYFHTRLFPDSILNNENKSIIEDVSHTNSIHKIYICSMDHVQTFNPGDPIVIYRTSDGKGPAYYRSVATSICVFEEYKNLHSFSSEQEFIDYCRAYSIFSISELKTIYKEKKYTHILKFSYNVALKKRVTRKALIEEVQLNSNYWGCFSMSIEQLNNLATLGEINESIIVN